MTYRSRYWGDYDGVDNLEISNRARGALDLEGIRTVGDLRRKDMAFLLRIPNCGWLTAAELWRASGKALPSNCPKWVRERLGEPEMINDMAGDPADDEIAAEPVTGPVPPQQPVVADSALAPEVFVDGYLSYMTTLSGMAKLTFFSQQHNVETNRQELRVVLRLAMPIVVAGALQQSLAANLAQTEASMGEGRAN